MKATNGNLSPNLSFTTESNSGSIFETIGAGAHYLPESDTASRGTGNSAMPEWLFHDFRERTTWAPEVHSSAQIKTNWALNQTVPRLTIPPDRGFYYPALDYAFGSNILTNASMTIPHGVAIATFTPATDTHGLFLERGANLVAEGQGLDRVRIVRYNTVQEQANTNWSSLTPGPSIKTVGGSVSPQPKGTFTFTEWSVPDGAGHFYAQSGSTDRYSFNHCFFNSGTIDSEMPAMSFTNCLVERVNSYLSEWPSLVLNYWRNCTFFGGQIYFDNGSDGTWEVFDCLFYNTTDLGSANGVQARNNAYLTNAPTISGGLTNVITNIVFQTGWLSRFYLPTNSPLLNKGSRNATNAGLYHFTTMTNQWKETNSIVDIGWHAVALASATRYLDWDDDGLPDYYEDKNGNGVADAGETDWQDNDTDNDGIDDNHFTLYWEMDHPSKPDGTLIRGPGFRVHTDIHAQPDGAIRIWLQQMYRGMPLNIWSGIGPGHPHESGIYYNLPAPSSGNFTKYLLKYDLRNLRWSVTNSSGAKLVHQTNWLDNMTERMGADGPPGLWTTNVNWIQNASFTPAPFARSVRYVWEGVIGNTSAQPVGPSVHAPWWPILKMVSKGTNVFYTCGYNESKFDLQKFHTSNPQFVVTNFSRTGGKFLPPAPSLTNLAYYDDNTIVAKYTDGATHGFDVTTCSNKGSSFTFPSAPTIGFTTNGYGAIALHPENSQLAALYYTNREQVVVYTNAQTTNPTSLFTIGMVNGYSNGPSITTPTATHDFRTNQLKLCSYYFDADSAPGDHRVYTPVLCFQSDGKLWVSDAATTRMLRFDTSGLCDAWFMFVAHSYTASVDPNNAQRVFMGYLEFEVDYSKLLPNSWTLKNYWGRESGAGRPETPRGEMTVNGLSSVTRLTYFSGGVNVRTYALTRDTNQANARRIVELTSDGLRPTPVANLSSFSELNADGSYFRNDVSYSAMTAAVHRLYITNWSGADPQYQDQKLGWFSFTTNLHPVHYSSAKTNPGLAFLSFPGAIREESLTNFFSGWHLGAVNFGSPGSWVWTNLPTGPLNGRGFFDTNIAFPNQPPGTKLAVVGDDLFYGYRGEHWKRHGGGQAGQANQFFHYKTNGTFVGRFGTPRFVDGTLLNAPGAAGNVLNFSAVKANGVIYIYTADEWSHGVHR